MMAMSPLPSLLVPDPDTLMFLAAHQFAGPEQFASFFNCFVPRIISCMVAAPAFEFDTSPKTLRQYKISTEYNQYWLQECSKE